jgi:3-deoxy-manno-octulosonate cytidylyltransferase (CMP-KDO synthetase)
MTFRVVIPARYGATRLPGKPLRRLLGKPLVQYAYENAVASGADEVVIATDDHRIREAAEGFGAVVCMTSTEHRSGTERLAEVAERNQYATDSVVVNVQGDEPLLPPLLIRQVAEDLASHPAASIATLCTRLGQADQLFNPNVVKVVRDRQGYALYFSRAPIPWDRDGFAVRPMQVDPKADYFHHIGLYAYRAGFLREYVRQPPCQAETLESLEQLRALWYGYRIYVAEASARMEGGVDTEEDFLRVERLLLVAQGNGGD